MERYFLTDDEYIALNDVASDSHMDYWFYLVGDYEKGDYVIDLENDDEIMDFKEAIYQLYEGIVEPTWTNIGKENQNTLIELSYKLFGENIINA